jgi:hypothetical protein
MKRQAELEDTKMFFSAKNQLTAKEEKKEQKQR